MGRLAAGAGALALLGLASPLACGAAPAATGMERLREFLQATSSMEANFRQEVVDADQSVVEKSQGRMSLKRPGRFRWDYVEPYVREVVADGARLWLYEADLQQVTVRPLAAALGETPAALLTGDRTILDRFDFVSAWSGEQLQWVKLKPRSADSDFVAVAIAFDGNRPVELVIDNRLGQQTRLFLSDIRMNPPLADSAFDFKVPEGVDVIREGGA